jgi:peptidoglycan hydrolase-like protein with peptidoglycan-binding domain
MLLTFATSSCGGAAGEGTEADASSSQPQATSATTDGPAPTLPPPLEIEEGGVLTVGAEGPAVRRLQEALAALGYDPGTPDGVFGPATRSAVMDFQRSNRLNPDGIAGERTLEAINDALELMGAEGGE